MTHWRVLALRTAVIGGFAIAVAALGIGVLATPAAADEHRFEEATDYTDEANFTINLPERTDHYPGNHPVHSESDGYNASIEYFAVGADAMRAVDAEEGAFIDTIIIRADFIDYSECDDVRNTKAFGIDRGNNNSGTNVDEDLVPKRKSSTLKEGGLTIKFFSFEDFSNDPPYAAATDAIVAAQGVGSNGGPCLKMTSEPGWYQVQGFINGTEADNGPDQEPSADARRAGIRAFSNYIYICECDSEGAAREALGPPPNEAGGDPAADPTPTATERPDGDPTPTPTPASDDGPTTATEPPATATQQSDATPTPTGRPATATQQPDDASGGQGVTGANDRQAGGQNGRIDRHTPTVAQGPGFTPVVALVALLAGATLLARRP